MEIMKEQYLVFILLLLMMRIRILKILTLMKEYSIMKNQVNKV